MGAEEQEKTYLIKTFFSNSSGVFFEQTRNDSDIKSQLKNFSESLSKAFYKNLEKKQPYCRFTMFPIIRRLFKISLPCPKSNEI